MRICFYAAIKDPRLFQLVEFYRQDVEILRGLGHEVRQVRRPSELSPRDDLYWVWWQTSGAPAILTARLRRRPSVLVTALSENDQSASGMPSKPALARMAARFSLAAADLVLATSDDVAEGLSSYWTRRVRAGLLGVDTERYRPAGGESDPPFVLTISHLTEDNVERKRILDVVEVAALTRDTLPDHRFVIVGGLEAGAARVREAIERFGVADRVELRGRVGAQEKVELLQGCSMYLQPTEYEAFGVAVAEAMACGKVVVSNAVGAVPEVVGSAGVLLPPDASAEALAGGVLAVLTSDDRHEQGRRARAHVEVTLSLSARRDVVRSALATVA